MVKDGRRVHLENEKRILYDLLAAAAGHDVATEW
jgi:hypothetical protein